MDLPHNRPIVAQAQSSVASNSASSIRVRRAAAVNRQGLSEFARDALVTTASRQTAGKGRS
jgi:hypothetical protein